MNNVFQGKRVLITGGTGSFGSSFAKFLLKKTKVKKLIIFSRDEFKQHYLEKEIGESRTTFFIGDIRDLPRLQRAFCGVDIVVHAAALKQVPAIEYNPLEAIKTNAIGSQNVIEAAIDQKVSRVLCISTDKAVQPVNLYGATKLCAEKLFVSANSYSPNVTTFSAVRYGNVIGSRGSIVEILLNKPNVEKVYITDPEMTRFWITLNQSFNLVSFALENMEGGEIFVPKIPSMKLVDLFNAIVPHAKQEIIGVRPGEKLHELLLTEHESKRARELKKYFVILPETTSWIKRETYKKYKKEGKKVAPDFIFASNTNDKWLGPKELKKILSEK
ncbi:MAG: UDP-N-acetylglucosamine 4,6-dehydratase (inverting) [Patescibacteria group bacterium]